MIGMRHLQPAVVGFELAGDEAAASRGQEALEISGIGVEIDELERAARIVLDQHAIGRARSPLAPAARPVLGDRDFEGGKLADLGLGDARHDRPVDDAHGKMPNEIDDARMRPLVPRRHELVQEPLDLGPHALQRAHRGEERRELSGSHGFSGKRALEPRGLGAVAQA